MNSFERSPQPLSHRWTKRFLVALSVAIASFGAWGWLTQYGLLPAKFAVVAGGALMAGVCLVAQGVCNNMAVEARRARAVGLKYSSRAAGLVALGFGAVSAMGLHHGWRIAVAVAPAMGVAPPPDWLTTSLFVFVACGEPISFWIVEAVKSGGNQMGRPLAPNQSAPASQPAGVKSAKAWSPRVVSDQGSARTKASAVGVVAAAALALGGVGEARARPSPQGLGEAAVSAAVQPSDHDGRARALAASGWSERVIAVELGLSRHAVRRALGRVARVG
jgi:hypothetical protein